MASFFFLLFISAAHALSYIVEITAPSNAALGVVCIMIWSCYTVRFLHVARALRKAHLRLIDDKMSEYAQTVGQVVTVRTLSDE